MIFIKETQTDAEELYQEYLNYKNGDKLALERIFVETSDRLQELTNKYYSYLKGTEYMDYVLDSEFIKAEIADEQKKHNSKIRFRHTCINRILSNAKWAYSRRRIDTGYKNGVKAKAVIENSMRENMILRYSGSILAIQAVCVAIALQKITVL